MRPGTGYVSSIFADDMTWETVGHSAASRRYARAAEFIAEVESCGGYPAFSVALIASTAALASRRLAPVSSR